MARRRNKDKEDVNYYKHKDEKRKNAVPVGLSAYDTSKPDPKKYKYDPHLDPQLQWAGKAEHTSFEVPTVSLHIHEHVAPEAIIRSVKREPTQGDLFAKPDMPLKELVEFYQHDMDWSNRMILGDSLLVMNSLLEREIMAGKVQCIYIDPPYGVKYASNFQPTVNQRIVKEIDKDIAREPEQIKAYRDTWELGVHSYLTYLRDRLLLSRELLNDTGSVFVQISDENLHHVKELMDEVFGKNNHVNIIFFKKTGGLRSNFLASVGDYILWYAKDIEKVKYRQLYSEKKPGEPGATQFKYILTEDGRLKELTPEELKAASPKELISHDNLTSQGNPVIEYKYKGKVYKSNFKPPPKNLDNLAKENRLIALGNTLRYIRRLTDFPYFEINQLWDDLAISGFSEKKKYVVQTNPLAIQRCILMCSDPGELVFDPTCGSGTTAVVAEQWGRRWITCDTSRIALTIARQKLMTSVFPYYKLNDEEIGVKGNFQYEEVPHIQLTNIANNEPPKIETLFDRPIEDKKRIRVSGPFTVEGIPQHSVSEFEAMNYETELQQAGEWEATAPKKIDAATHIQTLTELLRKDGVTFPKGKSMKFENLTPVSGSGNIHAEGEPVKANGINRVAVSFGPAHGPVTVRQVEGGIREANVGGYNAIVFCGLAFDSSAMDVPSTPNVQVFYSHIRPDVMMSDLLKTTASSQLFTVFGEPDIEVKKKKNEYQVILKGVDIYDPLTGEVYSDNGDSLAAWFIDTDYDKRSFCISQAYFPDGSAWDKLKRALKAEIDEDKFDMLTSTTSLPFEAGEQKQIAVKVIDHRGNEVMVVRELG